jgi:lysophospholipase L1-like esterase
MHQPLARSKPSVSVRLAAVVASVGILVGGLALAEALLRYTGKFATYHESNNLVDLGHVPEFLNEPYLYVYRKNLDYDEVKPEFTTHRKTNSDGLVGPDFPLAKAPGEFRIITIGDSFTEGIGAPFEESYPAFLQRLLASKQGERFVVLNAGVGGSDPVLGIELLQRKLLRYKPDLVILAMNHSDVADLKRRGNQDRFDSKGQMKSPPLAWWTPLFDRSHVVRAVMLGILGYDWDLHSPQEAKAMSELAVKGLVDSGVRGTRLGAQNGFKFVMLVHPGWWELDEGYPPEIMAAQRGLKDAGVDTIDVRPFLSDAIPRPITPDWYWMRDHHFTGKGYELMAKGVYAGLEKRGIVKP